MDSFFKSSSTKFLFTTLLISAFLIPSAYGVVEKKSPAKRDVEVVGDQLEYQQKERKMIAKGNVVVTYGDVKMTSDYAEVENESKKAYARGHVVVVSGDAIAAKGDEVFYDFGNDEGRFPDGRSVEYPWYTRGEDVKQIKRGKYSIKNAEITTCELEQPHWAIKARHATVYRGDKIVARDITLRVLGKGVFWWPYMVIPLQTLAESPIQIEPGYSSEFGGYILTSKSFSIVKQLGGKWHADWRAKRGFGGGLDFGYHFDKYRTDGEIKTYLTQDERAPTPGIENPYSERRDQARGRVLWKHRTDFNPDTYLLARYNKMEDEFFLQDFFEREFRADIEPTSFVNFTSNSDRHGFYAFNQMKMNRFENTLERLPEIRFDWKNAPFFSDKVYYESENSFSNLNQRTSRSPIDFNTVRADTFHEWTMPMKWNEIKLTPSANFRETFYSRDRFDDGERVRTAFGTAVDLRSQFYRVFNTSFDFLGIEVNQLRHVFEPSVRYDSVLESTISNEELYEFDSIDAVDDAQRFTFGIENRIQTKRMVDGKMQRVDLVSLNTFLSYDIRPDEEFSRSGFSIWSGEITVRPYSWLQFELRYNFDMFRKEFSELNEDLIAQKGRFHVLFGHRYVADRPFINALGNNQFVFDAGFWLNDLWEVGGHIRFNAENGKLEEWQISATRDLHDFLLDMGYNVRNSDIEKMNNELFFLLRLKAYPQYPLKSGRRAGFSEPRIGATVAGSAPVENKSYTRQ